MVLALLNSQNSGAAVNSTKFPCDTLPHMSIRAGVVVPVTFQQVNYAPNAQTSAERNHQRLKNANRRLKKSHVKYGTGFIKMLVRM